MGKGSLGGATEIMHFKQAVCHGKVVVYPHKTTYNSIGKSGIEGWSYRALLFVFICHKKLTLCVCQQK
jgi:hypothetical protein